LTNVLLYTDSNVMAGTERHILTLANALIRLGLHATIGCPEGSALQSAAALAQIPVLPVRHGGMSGTHAILDLRRLLRSRRINLVHAHNGRTSLLGAIAIRSAGNGKLVLTQHFIAPAYTNRRGVKGSASRFIHRIVDAYIAHTLAISDAVRQGVLSRKESDEQHVTRVHNGIDPPTTGASRTQVRKELGIPETSSLLVCATRLEEEKSVDVLLRALALLKRHDATIDLRCVICGDGSKADVLLTLASELRLTHVQFVGFRTDVPSLMAAADVVVLPAPNEPFGLVLLEAMAVGTPVVAMRAGGPLEVVCDQVTGLLATPNDPIELQRAIAQLCHDPAIRTRLAAAASERFKTMFSADTMATLTAEIYRSVLSTSSR